MKHEKRMTFFAAVLLGTALGYGTAGCLVTAFDLRLQQEAALLPVCLAAAVLCSAACLHRHGPKLLAAGLVLGGVLLWRDGHIQEQLLYVIQHISGIYDRAYNWGYLALGAKPEASADLPMALLGMIPALATTDTLCRGKGALLPVFSAVLPLFSCVVVTDTVPEEGYLLAVLTVILLLLLTDTVRREDPAQGIRLILGATLPVVAGLLLLFLTAPRDRYVNQSERLRQNILLELQRLPRLMEEGLTQIAVRVPGSASEQVDLSNVGRRMNLTTPVMEVISDQSGILYLRGQDYDGYDGKSWTSGDRSEVFSGGTGRESTVTIRTKAPMGVWYLPYYPAEPVLLTNGAEKNQDAAVSYIIQRRLLPDNWRQEAYLQQGGKEPLPERMQSRYLALPETTRAAAERYLAGSLETSAGNTEKADRIAAMVTDCASYDRDPPKMPEGKTDFALWFLEESDRGYCVHFATAATVLLRAAGVPARYVTGYMIPVAGNRPATITGEEAHAWAEYYEPVLGCWIPLEVTPADDTQVPVPAGPATEPTVSPGIPQTQPPVTVPPNTIPPETGPEAPAEPLPEQKPDARGGIWWAVIPVAVIFLAAAQRFFRLWLRRRRYLTAPPNRKALLCWRDGETMSRLLGESPPEDLLKLAQKAKFSRHTLTKEELQVMEGYCRDCLRRLKAKPWYLRLLHKYLYAAY